ncbi:MAG TPA: hypothetical protein VH142_16835 [Polyangiaceae bacterium]|nr:hypothetical protein [Polyangiaceae bacterium]
MFGLMDVLPQDDCATTERCAPCYNPNDGSDTHACEQGCDPGPSASTKQSPLTFTSCGKGRGVCVPKDIIPPVLLSDLPVDTCTQTDYVCGPLEKTQNLKYNFPECVPDNAFVALLESLGTKLPPGQSGGCVPEFLADDNPIQGIFLTQGTCKTGDKCAPCFNPLDSDKPTGACPVELPSDDGGGAPPASANDAGSTSSKKDGG